MEKMILISAGHYPERPGACFKSFCEHNEALKWRDLLVETLNMLGANSAPVNVGPLIKKVEEINFVDPICAIEIHFNSARKKNDEGHWVNVGQGSETLYCPGSTKGKYLASAAQAALAKVFTPDRGVKEGYYQMNPDKGVDHFLKETHCPAIIIEPDFIQHNIKITENRALICGELALAIKQASIDIQNPEEST